MANYQDIFAQNIKIFVWLTTAVRMNALVVNFGNVYLLASTHKSVFTLYQTNRDKRAEKKVRDKQN